MESVKRNAMRCGILRSEPAEVLPGFVIAWRARTMTVLVAPRAGLQLDEPVVVKIGSIARLDSRVVSIVWQDAGDLVGLAVLAAKTSDPASSEYQPLNRTRSESVS